MYGAVVLVVLLSIGGVTEIPEVRSLVKLQKTPLFIASSKLMGSIFRVKWESYFN